MHIDPFAMMHCGFQIRFTETNVGSSILNFLKLIVSDTEMKLVTLAKSGVGIGIKLPPVLKYCSTHGLRKQKPY